MEKAVLVTGASSGIGAAVSKYLSDQGYSVVLVARNKDRLNQIADRLCGTKFIISYDLTDLEHIENIYLECRDKGIKLDGLVHCAGINNDIPIRANDIEIMKQVTTINYYAFVELGKYFNRKKYSNEGASIIALSSSAAFSCSKGMCTYAASKAAINATVKVMGKEFLKRRQRVNAICPTFVDTPMAARMDASLGDLEKKVSGQPLGLIDPVHLAYLAEFLLSDKSSYITGACIPVSGGAIL